MDRPVGIPVKHVELCHAEISHFLVLVSDVISIHVKFDQFKNFDPVADPGSSNFWTLLQTQQACGYVLLLSVTTCDLLEDRADQIGDKDELLRCCFDASNSGCDRAPIGPPTPPHTHTFVTAPYRIFLARTGLTGTGVYYDLSCHSECLRHIPRVLFL